MASSNTEFLFQCSSPSLFGFDRDLHSHRSADDDGGDMHHVTPSARLSDVHLASRKANEAALRRYQAASWLQTMVGPLELPPEPSEEELRLCLRNGLILCNLINKIHPGAVLKIVDNPAPSSPPPQGAALSAYQYFENVRNFLVAVQEMNLPSFEASDLEQGSLQMGSSAKVVDCILSLKAYHEWQLGGGQGLWKFAGPWKSPCALKPAAKLGSGRSLDPPTSKTTNQFRKCWAFSGFDGSKNLSGDLGNLFAQTGKLYGNDPSELLGNSTEWVQHLSQKFVDIFHTSTKNLQEVSTLGMPNSARDLDSIASESLLKVVMLALQDRQPEEVPMLVEFMLRKVMEEFERRLSCQEEQLKQAQVQASEMLPTGMNNCSEHLNKIQALEMELKRALAMDQQRARTLESQSYELNGLKNSLESTRVEFQNMDSAWKKEMDALELKLQGLVQAASQYHKVVAENRELYNQVQDLKGNIRVYCRVRPFLPGQNNNQSVVDFIGEKGSIMIANPAKQGKERKTFNFNKIFGPTVTQEDVFLDTQPLIRSVLDGYNVCIFAYGQTGSGKTHTMTGPNNPTPKDWGVNFRALHDLFQISENRKDLMNYEVGVQMMEIYNEQVRDLLSTDGANKRLEIRNNSQQNGLNVPDANMVHVESTEDVLELMALGHKNRAVGSTALNERSSRSHSVLTVHVKGTDLASGAVLRGCLHLVDLAGSERVDRSEAVGERLKEAQHINKSLSALGDVIAALAQKSAHIPYRNSKLTQLLQDSLGGQAKTLMFVHISPDDESYSETISTLKFAERVATVELGAAQSNKESGEVRDLKDQVAFLKEALAKKDGELERVQKELKSKNTEIAQEKPRVRPGISPSQNMLQKCTSGDMVQHGQAKRRQPLEEVRNSEVRHSPGSLSILAQKSLPIKSIDLSQQQPPHTPLAHAGMHDMVHVPSQEEDSATKRRAEDDSGKLRASKLARQGSCFSEEEENEEGRDSTRRAIGFYSEIAASTVQSSSRNNIRCENSVETDITSSLKTPQDRTRIGRNFNFTVETTPLGNKSAHGAAPSPSAFHADIKRDSRFAAEVSRLSFIGTPPAATPMSCFDEREVPKQDSSNGSNRDCSSISEDSAGHTGRRVHEEEEEHESSNILRSMHEMEEALRAVDVCSNRVAGNKRQGPQSKSSTSHKQQTSSSLPKKKAGGAALTGQALVRARRRYSLANSNKDESSAAESNKGGAKAIPTFEAKLIGEGGPLERSSLARQSVVGLAPALGGSIHPKSSKRWV